MIDTKNVKQQLEGLLGEYFYPDELADELGVSIQTLALWRMLKKGPPVTRMGRRVLYHRDAAREWLRKQENAFA